MYLVKKLKREYSEIIYGRASCYQFPSEGGEDPCQLKKQKKL